MELLKGLSQRTKGAAQRVNTKIQSLLKQSNPYYNVLIHYHDSTFSELGSELNSDFKCSTNVFCTLGVPVEMYARIPVKDLENKISELKKTQKTVFVEFYNNFLILHCYADLPMSIPFMLWRNNAYVTFSYMVTMDPTLLKQKHILDEPRFTVDLFQYFLRAKKYVLAAFKATSTEIDPAQYVHARGQTLSEPLRGDYMCVRVVYWSQSFAFNVFRSVYKEAGFVTFEFPLNGNNVNVFRNAFPNAQLKLTASTKVLEVAFLPAGPVSRAARLQTEQNENHIQSIKYQVFRALCKVWFADAFITPSDPCPEHALSESSLHIPDREQMAAYLQAAVVEQTDAVKP